MPDGLISIKKLYPSLCDELILWKSNNRIATIQLRKHNVFQLHEKKSSPVSSFTTLIFSLTALVAFPGMSAWTLSLWPLGWGNTKEEKKLVLTSVKHLSLEHVQTKLQGVCKVIMVAGDVLWLVIARILICLSWKPMTYISCIFGHPFRWTL